MPRILILTANSKTTPLELAREVHDIRASLGEHSNFSIHHEHEVQGRDFINLLTKQRADILHFAGHGGDEQSIALRSGEEHEAPLAPKELASILHWLPVRPRLVVLNACSTSELCTAVKPYVGAVVGTSGRIGDLAAQQFSKNFYTTLGASQSVAAAFELAKLSVNLAGYEGDMLELKYAENLDPEKLIFYATPEIMACFNTKGGKPEITKENYELTLWLRGVDENIESVTFQACHDFKEPFWEVLRSTSPTFESDFSTYLNVILRAVAWSKERGIGTESSLVSALERHYGEKPSAVIKKAIDDLRTI
jgi:CHAT domain-containing protein